MLTTDITVAPRVSQAVRYQTPSTHVITAGIITAVNSDGTVAITSFAAGVATSRTSVIRGSLDGSTSGGDNRFDYGEGT